MAYDPETLVESAPVDMTGSRSTNTTYQNLTGRNLRVKVSFTVTISAGVATSYSFCVFNTSPTGMWEGGSEQEESGLYYSNSAITEYFAVEGVVPPGYYYTLAEYRGGNANWVSEIKWLETTL